MLSIIPISNKSNISGKNNTTKSNPNLKLNSQPISDSVSFGKKIPTNVLDDTNRKLVEKLGTIWQVALGRSHDAFEQTIKLLKQDGLDVHSSYDNSNLPDIMSPNLTIPDGNFRIEQIGLERNPVFAIRTNEYKLRSHPIILYPKDDNINRVSIIISQDSNKARILKESNRLPRIPFLGEHAFRTDYELQHTNVYDVTAMNEFINQILTPTVAHYSTKFEKELKTIQEEKDINSRYQKLIRDAAILFKNWNKSLQQPSAGNLR